MNNDRTSSPAARHEEEAVPGRGRMLLILSLLLAVLAAPRGTAAASARGLAVLPAAAPIDEPRRPPGPPS